LYTACESTDVHGLRVYGTPWSSGTSSNRAFQSPKPTVPPADLGPVDVLLSHCHSDLLATAVRPSLYLSGHAHRMHGVLTPAFDFGGVAVNAAICDGVYCAANLPVVVDLRPRAALAASARTQTDGDSDCEH
jgi:hypothetical protein